MKKTQLIFGIYALLIAFALVGIASQLSNASSGLQSDQRGIWPTNTPPDAGTVPTRTPSPAETVPTRTPSPAETIPTRTPAPSVTILTRTPGAETASVASTDASAAAETKSDAPSSRGNDGSMIVLKSASADGDDWVTIEWLAGDGNWYEVNGWRGHISNGQIMWWVGQENLGAGPFRWVVYADESAAERLAVSDPFNLPEQTGIERSFQLDW